MKAKITKDDPKNHVPPPPIFYNTYPNIGNNLMEKSDSLKVDIKDQRGEIYRKTVAIYMKLCGREVRKIS